MKTILRSTLCMKTGTRFLLLMTFMLVVGGLMSPLMPLVNAQTDTNIQEANAAQPLEPLDPESTEAPDGQGEQPPAGEQPSETVPPDNGESQQPTEDPGQQGLDQQVNTGQITVNLHWCPPTADVANATDGNLLKPDCGIQGGPMQVSLTSSTSSNPAQQQSANTFPGSVQFSQLPSDSWVLSLQAGALDNDALFCVGNTPYGNTKPYARQFLAQVTSPTYPIDTINEETIVCDWFAIAAPAEDTGVSLTIYKWECPPGVMMGQADSYYSAECATEQAGVPFQVTDDDGTQDTTSDTNGRQIDGLNGQITIQEMIPQGFADPVVFCQLLNDPASTLMPSAGGTVTLQASTTDDYQCFWYNIPGGMGTQQTGSGDVLVYAFSCAITPPQGSPYSWYFQNCTTSQNGVTFVLDVPDPGFDVQTDTGDNIPGAVMMGGVEAGSYPLTATPPAGFAPSAAFCATVGQNEMPTPGQFTSVPLNANSISATVTADMTFFCHWFNVQQAGEGISLTIYKWQCPPDTMYAQADSYYSAECAMEQPGVPFTITDSTGSQQTTSDTNGRQIDDLLGQIIIQETIPTGYGEPVVYCQLLNDPASTLRTSTDGRVTLPASTTDDYQCFWYNLPFVGLSLTIYKWECPPGTQYGQADPNYYSTECATEQPGVPFEITDDNGTQNTTSDTNGRQIDGLIGDIRIQEIIPPGFGDPVVYCQTLNMTSSIGVVSTNGLVTLGANFQDDYQCFWYNIPETPSTVTIYKWRCPDGMPAEKTQTWFETNCKTTPQDGVIFTLTDSQGPRALTTAGGTVQWTDVSSGAVQLSETIPPGFDPHPYLVCVITVPNTQPATITPTTVNGTWNTTIDTGGTDIRCDWYNWYLGPGEITVFKWLCPEGYDRHAWGADPTVDCTQKINGINFKLDQPDPEVDLFTMTGDNIDSAVYFGGLAPGDYTISEMVSAGEYKDIFVWECYGLNWSSVHPTPLSVGQSLDFKIVGGDKIECHWFNVPHPQHGYMVVTKFNCSTETYVSDAYCYTNQTGQAFDLQNMNGTNWTTVQSGTTDVSGKVTFDNLEGGDYRLIEPNMQACLMKSSNITPGGNIGVKIGEGTTVYVYNCKVAPPEPTKPGKYPNTGVGPTAGIKDSRTPGIALTGLAGLMGLAMNRRRVVAGVGLVTAGTAATALPILNAQELLPLDSTPAPGTPAPEDFWCATPTAATPGAATPAVDPCNRGPIPTQMRIPVIDVDAPIEYLEVIDGLMQQPTGDTHIAWYKETSRLGEVGNGLYAAHVNWWNNPEGIFFRLESLKEGDVIEIDGADLRTHLFAVQWVQDFPSDEEPPEEALGLTDEVAITLITCGGEWSSALSEYNHRTLVRAVLRE